MIFIRWIRDILSDATFWLVLVFVVASGSAVYVLSRELGLPAEDHQHDIVFTNLLIALGIAFAAAIGLTVLLARQRRRALEKVEDLVSRERSRNVSLQQVIARAEAGEAQVGAIIDTMLDGLVTISPDGIIDTANRAAVSMFGARSSEEVTGRSICDFLPETEGRDTPFSCCEQPVSGSPLKGYGERQEMVLRRVDGRETPVEVAISELEAEGLHVFTAIFHDLTEQKAAAEKLRRAETRLVDAIESLPDGFVLYDADDRLVLCNSKYREFYASSAEFIKEGERFEDIIRNGAARGQYVPDIQNVDEWVEMRLALHRNPGEAMEQHLDDGRWLRVIESRTSEGGLVGFRVDITELKHREEDLRQEKERAEVANEAKAKFLAMMSHEIRTPLNGVLGILSLLSDTGLTQEQKMYVRTARDSGRALLELINDILDFTKLEARRMELDVSRFRLHKVLYGIVDLFAPIAREKKLALKLEYPRSVPTAVSADAGRIRQVVLNLVSNALKFTEMGSVIVSVSIEREDPVKPTFLISVTDSGIGIPKDKHETLFGEFTTVDTRYARKQGGTGLGLAICKQLAELMGGTVRVESMPGAGSTFLFSVPLTLAKMEDTPSGTEERQVGILPPGLRILLAEDNATNQIVVSHALEKAGCDVDIANNGKEAVRYSEMRNYDCILMDISMPEMDGLEATRHIREAERNQRVPIIALTAYSLQGDRETFLKAGMDDFLSKPVEKDDLIAMILHHVSEGETVQGGSKPEEPAVNGADLNAAREILASMPEEIQGKLLFQFESDILKRCEAVRDAHNQNDLETLERATHAMKSVAGTFGAKDLAEVSARVNQLARDEKHGQAMGCIDELLETSNRTLAEVGALAASMGLKLETPNLQ
ncbi:ATP-binding protein [Roseibium sp. RKSG952]|uniref:PAS domain-containing hybrid sensor histidine kinase/response regulator n=1 Tax=Roseibium sp. RKSG952 TaxID=2529384 RepID=UPI001AD8B91E|nr:ATP-binding protein [Roseibium sp. RKSG952]